MEDTIAAIATAYGEGGIGIVRISGEKAKEILDKVFQSEHLQDGKPIVNKRLYYGNIIDRKRNKKIDEVLAVYMKGPGTYTGEDVVEINCHGSSVSLRNTLALVLASGARLAEKGEFTKRAFLNGRLDLSQAEAVIDVVRAKTDKSYDVALQQMEGGLSQHVHSLREKVMDVLVNLAVNIDYPDEDIEEMTYEELKISLLSINDDIDKLLATADTGRMIREGIKVAIVGKPNVGKSSLLNALLKESRAIVTEIAGTTRDTIEEVVSIQGIPVQLTDTAGIRETEDLIEQIGIEKSKEAFNKADLILFIIDGSQPLTQEDKDIMAHMDQRKSIVMINKTDLPQVVIKEEIAALLPSASLIEGAIKHGAGIRLLETQIVDLVYHGQVKQEDSMMVTNVRHKDLLEQARSLIQDAMKMTEKREALDFVEMDIRSSYDFLGEIIGESVTDDIIDQVFARFCLGK